MLVKPITLLNLADTELIIEQWLLILFVMVHSCMPTLTVKPSIVMRVALYACTIILTASVLAELLMPLTQVYTSIVILVKILLVMHIWLLYI